MSETDFYSIFKRIEDKGNKFKFIDTHVTGAITSVPKVYISKETKVTMWIVGIFVLALALILFFVMIPFRLFADIKLLFHDVMNHLEND